MEEKYKNINDINDEIDRSIYPIIEDIGKIAASASPTNVPANPANPTNPANPSKIHTIAQHINKGYIQNPVQRLQNVKSQSTSSPSSSYYDYLPDSNTSVKKKVNDAVNLRDNNNDTFRKVVKVLQKHYELKNLINFNNKNYSDDDNKEKNEYNNPILQLNYDIDVFNDNENADEKDLKKIKNKLISFENNPNNPYVHIPISFEDRFVFIFTTFLIRYVSLILIQWSIDINIIKSFEEGFIYYAVLYIAIFWFFVLFINIDNTFKVDYMNIGNALNSIRSLFYYFYMGTNGITRLLVHSCIICVLIVVPVILNIKKYNNYKDEDKKEKLISYDERKKLNKSLSLFTIYLWILTSIIATKF